MSELQSMEGEEFISPKESFARKTAFFGGLTGAVGVATDLFFSSFNKMPAEILQDVARALHDSGELAAGGGAVAFLGGAAIYAHALYQERLDHINDSPSQVDQ